MLKFVHIFFLYIVLSSASHAAIQTNQSMIESLNKHDALDIDNIDAVFQFVLENTPQEITIYPSEGYYYFNFHHQGNLIKGNIRFGIEHRDKGILSFIYFYHVAGQERSDFKTKHKTYTPNHDSYALQSIEKDHYSLTFKTHKKMVVINQLTPDTAFTQKLEKQGFEINLPMMDESGIVFYLTFHPGTNEFYFINDRSKDDEYYYTYQNMLKIGARSRFAYLPFNDDMLILVGVSMDNVFQNNYYDGPFDQLPDQAIQHIDFKSYLEKMDKSLEGKINNYGMFIYQPGSRVAVSNYIEYEKNTELNKLATCTEANITALLTCIQPIITESHEH